MVEEKGNIDAEEYPESFLKWGRPSIEGSGPSARGGHSAVLAGTYLVIFGGHYYGGTGSFTYLNDTYCLDIGTLTWHRTRPVGDVPQPRYGHTATLVRDRMFVFGGKGDKKVIFKDMYYLDTNDWAWYQVNTTTASPSPRFDHGELLVGRKLVIFGGWNGRRSFNDMWVFDTDALTWLKPKTAGSPPPPRHGHSMELLPDGRILVFGGYSVGESGQKYLSDVRELDTETMVWSRPRVMGDCPSARMGQTTCLMGSQMVMFGGWGGVQRCVLCNVVKGKSGKAGIQHQPDCIVGKSLYATNAHKAAPPSQVDYLAVLDSDQMEWFAPAFSGVAPDSRYGHSMTRVGLHVFIFGGWDGTRSLPDLVTLDFPQPPPQKEAEFQDRPDSRMQGFDDMDAGHQELRTGEGDEGYGGSGEVYQEEFIEEGQFQDQW